MKHLLASVKENKLAYPYILIHRGKSNLQHTCITPNDWVLLRRRDFIELKAHRTLSLPTMIESASELIAQYIRFNPDYLYPNARLDHFELKLSYDESVFFSTAGKMLHMSTPAKD
ncbi:hypothetical protein ACPV5R_00195 [Vibrio astriarenae]|jgi:hypothetical protein